MTKPADKKKSQASKIAPKPNRIIKTNSPKREAELKALRQMIEAKAKLKEARDNRAELASIFASLKAEREKLGLSLAEMSERCGIAREVIYRLESQTKQRCNSSGLVTYLELPRKKRGFLLKGSGGS